MELLERKFGRTNYNIYVPENVNEDTPVVFYAFNTAFDKQTDTKEALMAQNDGAIVIVPMNTGVRVGGETSGHEYQTEAIDVFNFLKEEYDLNTTQFNQAGYSAGFGCSVRTLADYIKENPDAGRQVLISVDGCRSDNGFTLYNSELDVLEENDTIIISYSQKHRHTMPGGEMNFLKKPSVPILYVIDPELPEDTKSTWRHWHDVIPENFITKDLYNDLMNFALGNGELPEGYIYRVYNPETGLIEDIAREDVAEFFKINSYSTLVNGLKSLDLFNASVTSDSSVLINHVNNILSSIKNSSFVQSGNTYNSSFASTTNVPSAIPSIVQDYYSATAKLLTKLANDVKQFAKIGEIFEEEDKKMEQEANELNNLPINNTSVDSLSGNNNNVVNKDELDEDKKQDVDVNNSNSYLTEDGDVVKKDNNSTKLVQTEDGGIVQSDDSSVKIIKDNSNTGYNNNNWNTTKSNDVTYSMDDFLDFEEIYSDESRIVYEYDDNCRIIIHRNGDEILGIEHYYRFDDNNMADIGFNLLTEKYISNNNVGDIIKNDNYVKVIFKDDNYLNMSLDDIKIKFKDLNEVLRR